MASLYELTGQMEYLKGLLEDPEVEEKVVLETMESIEFEIEEKNSIPGVYLTRGPLVYSLPIKEKCEEVYDKTAVGDYPAYNIYPDGEWRYALSGDYSFAYGKTNRTLYTEKMPIVSVKAKRIYNLHPDKSDPLYRKGGRKYAYSDYTCTPRLPSASSLKLSSDEEAIELLPYGLCKLRMTVFDKVK